MNDIKPFVLPVIVVAIVLGIIYFIPMSPRAKTFLYIGMAIVALLVLLSKLGAL